MRILLSWIAKVNDMAISPITGRVSGPTLAILSEYAFDNVYIFVHDRFSLEKSEKLKAHVEKNPKEFGLHNIHIVHIRVENPTDHGQLWNIIPRKVEQIIKQYDSNKLEIFINISAGTPAMSTTWIMMVGSGQISATLLSPQLIRESGESYISTVNIGVYPFISQLKGQVDKQLNVLQKFKSPNMNGIMRILVALATSEINRPIMLLGETGTGKTTLAKEFHRMTGRKKFVHFVCGAFKTGDLNSVKSELFGHEKGAYTGANTNREGALKQVDGGTLLLDEIGDIPLDVQRMLIDVIENKEFKPLGSNKSNKSNFQLICATNQNIEKMLQEGTLFQDFFFRISSYQYEIPPLRYRKEDIPVIVEDLLKHNNYMNLNFDPDIKFFVIQMLQTSTLPGNIRSIQKAMDNLLITQELIKPMKLTSKEVEAYFKSDKEPSKDKEFFKLVQKLLVLWPETTYAAKGEKWKDSVLNIALKQLIHDEDYIKSNGELNINSIKALIGIDYKTIKAKLKTL